jgi:hypothetical protein
MLMAHGPIQPSCTNILLGPSTNSGYSTLKKSIGFSIYSTSVVLAGVRTVYLPAFSLLAAIAFLLPRLSPATYLEPLWPRKQL